MHSIEYIDLEQLTNNIRIEKPEIFIFEHNLICCLCFVRIKRYAYIACERTNSKLKKNILFQRQREGTNTYIMQIFKI